MNYSHRSPKGNRHMRRLLNQTANAAVKTKGSIFEIVYRRSVPRLGHNQANTLAIKRVNARKAEATLKKRDASKQARSRFEFGRRRLGPCLGSSQR